MDKRDFSGEVLRTWANVCITDYTYSYSSEPLMSKDIEICVLVGEQNFNHLVRLIPEVVNLKLKICDSNEIYDILPLQNLIHLKKLVIENDHNKNIKLPRLKNIDKLKQLEEFMLYEEPLDVTTCSFKWAPIRREEFEHITDINVEKNIITYNIRYLKINGLEECDGFNVLIQWINHRESFEVFQMIIVKEHEPIVKILTKQMFVNIIYGHYDNKKRKQNVIIPVWNNDLFKKFEG
jgi:hypothetical protein